MFGGFCSGVVVSNNGLVFTNHHCGFDAIQDHSSVKFDYLKNGFFAKKLKDELPNPELYVAFHLSTVDVTDKILKDIEEWQHRPLESIYPVVFIDACHFSVRDNGIFDVTLKDLTGHGKIDIKCLRCINVIRISFQNKLIRTEQIDA